MNRLTDPVTVVRSLPFCGLIAGEMSRVKTLASLALLFFSLSLNVFAQQPSPTPSPERTGRSYSVADPSKTPPPPGPQARSPLTFTNLTAQTGVNFTHAASKTSHKYLLETMGGGVAIFDYDNDGRMDLFFTNGAALKDPMPKDELPDKSQPKYWNRLYRQNSDGKFVDVTERAALKGVGYSMGVAAADYDNDGYVDLFVTGYKADRLYRNNGDGTFTDAPTSSQTITAVGPPAPDGSTMTAMAASIYSSFVTWTGTLKAGPCSVAARRRIARVLPSRQFQRRN